MYHWLRIYAITLCSLYVFAVNRSINRSYNFSFTISDEFANDIELTEEQQTLLLEEYEKEISTKKRPPTRDNANNNTKDKTTITKSEKKTKSAQTRDKLNNRSSEKRTNRKSQNKKANKPDECGNNLVEDYFCDKPNVADDVSANSDESWEKEFDIEAP